MENSCIFLDNDTLYLSSFLDEQGFGRTDLGKLINEKGTLAVIQSGGSIKYSNWNFERTVTDKSGKVFFEGKAFTGKLLSTILEENEKDMQSSTSLAKNAETGGKITAVFKVLDHIIKNAVTEEDGTSLQTKLPGPWGILAGGKEEDGSFKVLVLPGNIFDRCIENSRDYDRTEGFYKNKNLEGMEALLFTRSVLAYTILAGQKPFAEINFEKRQADFTDENFIPIEYCVRGISDKLAQAVNEGLRLKHKKRVIPGEKKYMDVKEEKIRLLHLENALKFDSSLLEEYLEDKTQTAPAENEEKDFSKRREEFVKKQQKKIRCSRFLRRNSKSIKIWALVCFIGMWALSSFYRTNQKLATSTGLTSRETVQTLMNAIHTADVTIIQEIAKGKEVKSLIQGVAGFYVTNKQRLAVDQKNGTLTPSGWLFFKGESDFWQYGITNLKIDGEDCSTGFKWPRRKDKKQPLKEEDGKLLKKGDKTYHTVNYDLIHYDGDNVIAVNSAEETVELTWNGRRWIVKSIKGKQKASSYKVKNYRADYKKALEETGDDIKKAAEILKKKYTFAPSPVDLRDGAAVMVRQYNNSAARDYIHSDTF